jgi:hypothetical protein
MIRQQRRQEQRQAERDFRSPAQSFIGKNRAERRAGARSRHILLQRERCYAALGGRAHSSDSTARLLAHVNRLVADRNKRAVARRRLVRRALAELQEMARADLQAG